MKISTVIIGIALFAIVTMILYGWGIVKQKNQTSDLMNLLFSKGQDKIKKYLAKRKNEKSENEIVEIEPLQLIENTEVAEENTEA